MPTDRMPDLFDVMEVPGHGLGTIVLIHGQPAVAYEVECEDGVTVTVEATHAHQWDVYGHEMGDPPVTLMRCSICGVMERLDG